MIYLTFNDQLSGIYSSQVIDVVDLLNEKYSSDIKLVAFVPVKGYWKNLINIRARNQQARVWPILFRLRKWSYNKFILKLLVNWKKKQTIIARGIFACNLALLLKDDGCVKKVCYDGRGAVLSEFREYHMSDDTKLNMQVKAMEEKAVNKSDFRIAVSNKLMAYWEQLYEFNQSKDTVIIPCTLGLNFKFLDEEEYKIKRSEMRDVMGYDDNDIVCVYAGSVVGWQSFDLMYEILENLMKNNSMKLLFLSPEDHQIEKLKGKFKSAVKNIFVKHFEVQKYLIACDFGLLLRKNSITNSVASPTKFAEYLAAGLKIIVSENVGDYSEFTLKHNCGYIVDELKDQNLHQPSVAEKLQIIKIAESNFSKNAQPNINKFRTLADNLNER